MYLSVGIIIASFFAYSALKASSAAEIIGFLSDENDEDATDIFRYLNMSQMYYVNNLKLENITVKHISITKATFTSSLCELLSNVTFLISACESEASRQLVVDVSHLSALPTIQIVRNNWSTVDGSTLPNQIYIVTTGTIFEYVILDIFPFLNIALDVTVLFDKTYRNTNNLRNVFEMLPVPVTFVNLQTNAAMLQRQVKHLKAIASKNIVVVADTAMIEMVVKEASVYFDARLCRKENPLK
ncbi:hypothetical protein NECAME_04692 [Necator americanus]|uniref:Receptor ligand binding region domain-containing protein n=1 Tax=Necator americanus TaxID=51031 RepID=W2SN61_NECAM|nr:hypothetical protein NECAME_04692 [Necator americanus]ETN71129.1 hypothetical protein NECAME_04692 [Necator americanus]